MLISQVYFDWPTYERSNSCNAQRRT